MAPHNGILGRYFMLFFSIAYFVGNFHSCFFHTPTNMAFFHFAFAISHQTVNIISLIIPMRLKGYIQSTTNAVKFGHNLETCKVFFPGDDSCNLTTEPGWFLLFSAPVFPQTPNLVLWAANGLLYMPQHPLQNILYLLLSISSARSNDSQTRLHMKTMELF